MPNSDLLTMPSAIKKQSPLDVVINWILRIIPAVIVGMAAYMKFSGNKDVSVMFGSLGMEPGGRILIGVIEAICVVLLLSSRISAWGAILSLGVTTGAVIAHCSILGFDKQLGSLFVMALVSTTSSILLIYRLRHQVPFVSDMFDS